MAKNEKIRKDLYIIEDRKTKDIEKNLLKLEKNLKKYYDYDDIEYRGVKDVKRLFDLSIYEDYDKPRKTNDAFNSNYIDYKSKRDQKKTLSIKEYLNMIKQYLRDIKNDHKTQGEWKVHSGNKIIDDKIQGEWKIQFTVIINFTSSKNSDEIRTMYAKSNNKEIMMGTETDQIIEELFESLLQKYKECLEEKMTESEFVFASIDLLHYNLHQISLNRGGSYIDSLKWLKNNNKSKK